MPTMVNNFVLLFIVRINRTKDRNFDFIFRNNYLGTCYILVVTLKCKKLHGCCCLDYTQELQLVQFITATSIFFSVTSKPVSSKSCILSCWHHPSLKLIIYYIQSAMLNLLQDLFCPKIQQDKVRPIRT